ncbi:hypothetical protein ACOMHN_036968 [Nucella lapillus]
MEINNFLLGSLLISVKEAAVPDFDRWLSQHKPENPTVYNSWFNDCWGHFFNCSISKGTCNGRQSLDTILTPDYPYKGSIGYIVDTVNMIGNAASRVIQSPECQNLTGTAIRGCVTGPQIYKELKATNQSGYSGILTVDKNGDRWGVMKVRQLRLVDAKVEAVEIADFDFATKSYIFKNDISWEYHHLEQGFDYVDSQCSFPCKRHEEKHVLSQGCCWKCYPCKVNERLINDGKTCEKCPDFTWPDDKNLSICQLITPQMLTFYSLEGIVQITLIVVFIIICVLVFVFFHYHRNHRVIKASSRGLSNLILLAIIIGYDSVIMFMVSPTNRSCKAGFLVLSMSFALIYGPLLIRTMWVYRVFHSSMKSIHLPRFSSSKHQIVFCCLIVLLQVR